MTTYDFVHLAFFAWGEKVQGRTKLQKLIYFLGIITESSQELGYRAHFYGPYSAEVASAVDDLRSMGFLDHSVTSFGADRAGFETARYDYSLNEQGTLIARQKMKSDSLLWKRISAGVEILKNAGDIDYVKLSIAAKTYFMLGEKKGGGHTSELARFADKFGWKVTQEQVQEAVAYLQKLGLVAERAAK